MGGQCEGRGGAQAAAAGRVAGQGEVEADVAAAGPGLVDFHGDGIGSGAEGGGGQRRGGGRIVGRVGGVFGVRWIGG